MALHPVRYSKRDNYQIEQRLMAIRNLKEPKSPGPKEPSRGQIRLAAEIATHLIRGNTITASQATAFNKARFLALETLHRLARG